MMQLQPNFLRRKLSPLGYKAPDITYLNYGNYQGYNEHAQIVEDKH